MAIDIRDLRFGDKVQYKDKVIEIDQILFRDAIATKYGLAVQISNLNPIPITKELILSMGFKEDLVVSDDYIVYGLTLENGFISLLKQDDDVWSVIIDDEKHMNLGDMYIDSLNKLQHFVWDCLNQEI